MRRLVIKMISLASPQYNYSLLRSYGQDVFISANVEIRRPHLVQIGNHIAIDTGFYCTTEAIVGDYIHIGPYVTIIGGADAAIEVSHFSNIAVGSRVICGSDEYLGAGLVGSTVPDEYRDRVIITRVIFEMFVNVGANAVILPGIKLGEGSVVGACSLVTKDTEPWTVNMGVPAKPIKARPKGKMIEAAKALGYL